MKTIETTITYLQMNSVPDLANVPSPKGEHVLMKLKKPTLAYYKYLYSAVGGAWLWWERNEMEEEKLKSIIKDPAVSIFVLYVDGGPGGYFELDYREAPEMELAYFGLIPELIGKGYGKYLINAAIREAWSHDLSRFWVHTCNLDHPNAINLYQKAGFELYNQHTELINDPRVV